MPITITQGPVNITALNVPGVNVGVIPPQPIALNGVASNVAGFVGTASYGPKNTPTPCQDYGSFSAIFGPLINRANDLGTAVSVAQQQGSNNFFCVRVTDGTDTAATGQYGISGATYAVLLSSRYTGSAANNFTAQIQASAYPNSLKLVLTSGLGQPEVFDGLTNSGPAAFWAAMVAAINNGTANGRARSAYFVASLGTNTTAAIPTVGSGAAKVTLASGTDGTTTITTSVLIGTDGTAGNRTGMYALRGMGCSWAGIPDLTDSTSWATQLAFGLSESVYMVSSTPSGDTISAWVSTNVSAQGYGLKVMFGDWCYWLDTVNGVTRLLSPIAFAVGRGANLPPQYSLLNQPIYGIVSTQFSAAGLNYGTLDLATLITAGLDVITPPGQGPGNQQIFCCATGNNTNYNPNAQGDNYTTLTNYIVKSLVSVGGLPQFLGQPLTAAQARKQKDVTDIYCQGLQTAGIIGNAQGGLAYQNKILSTPAQLAAGIFIMSTQVTYLAIERNIAIQFQGGQSVVITNQSRGAGQ